jgi:cell wall-associated NlpC family hydrolase
MHASHQRTTRALATLCAGAASTLVLTATPAAAEPDVDQARDRLSTVQDKRDETSTQSRRLSKDLAKAQAVLRETRSHVKSHEVALEEVEALIVAEEEDTLNVEPIAEASAVVRAENPSEALAEAQAEAEEVSLAPETAAALAERIDKLRDREARQNDKVDRLRAQAKKQGASLRKLRSQVVNAAERLEEARDAAREAARAARASRSAEREAAVPEAAAAPQAAPAASGGAGAAVAYAMAQVGDAYSYGSSGPDAFDCSGLTSMAWAQAGVSLPRTSGSQMGAGTPVSASSLQPGDLVFYYSPVSHVGIYVGNGQLVHAANPSTGVQLTSVSSMPISGAVRPG